MKILVAGDGRSKIHEKAVAKSFRELGHDVSEFHWNQYFRGTGIGRIFNRIEERLIIGPSILRLNKAFKNTVLVNKPDALFIYRGVLVSSQLIAFFKEKLPNMVIVGYNNDDPFSPTQSPFAWRKFRRALRFYDLVFAYRPSNVNDYLAHGAPRSQVLKPWYSKELHYPVSLNETDRRTYECEVAFIGHFEPDGRAELLSLLLSEGINLKLFGPMEPKFSGWDLAVKNNPRLKTILPTQMLWGEEYNKAILGSKITLCFLSKLNRDKYTRRCFEIPAVGGFLFSEYTDELASMFTEGKEAEYFRTPEEFLKKIKYYLEHDDKRRSIAAEGHNRVTNEGNDAEARALQVISVIKDLQLVLTKKKPVQLLNENLASQPEKSR